MPKNWIELEEWFRLIDKDIPSQDLVALLRRIPENDFMSKKKAKEYLNKENILSKSEFNQTWGLLIDNGRKDTEKDGDPTLKEEIERIATETLDKYDIITLNDTRQIMAKKNMSYDFNIDSLIEFISGKIRALDTGSYRTIKQDVLEIIRDSTLFDRKDFCYDKNLIVFKNGVYDVGTKTFYEEKDLKGLKFFYEIPFDFPEKKTKCNRFKKVVAQWIDEKTKKGYRKGNRHVLINDVFEWIGYCLTMNISLKKCVLLFGPTNSGKTQFITIVESLHRSENISHIALQRVCKNEFGTDGLQNIILNTHNDLTAKKIDHTGVFKDLVGGSVSVGAERKGGAKYNFRNVSKFLFAANKIPGVKEKDDLAFFDRFILFNFPNSFNNERKNRVLDFYENITTDYNEMNGIIYESIKGYERLIERNGFRESILENTLHIWNYESDPLYKFIHDNCNKEKNGRIQVDEFLEVYNEDAEMPLTKTSITKNLQRFNIRKKRAQIDPSDPHNKERDYYYFGIEWKRKPLEWIDKVFYEIDEF